MNNRKIDPKVNKLIDDIYAFWDLLCEENIKKLSFDEVPLLLFSHEYAGPHIDVINDISGNTARMITIATVYGHNDPDIDPNDRIIEYIGAIVLMSYEELYSLIIDCELDFDKAFESMKLYMRHEMGHIIDKQRFIGKTVLDWNTHLDEFPLTETLMPKLRKNASIKSRMKWFMDYHHMPEEKAANDAMGITDEELIEDFKRVSGI